MSILRGYLGLQIVVVTALVLTIGALTLLDGDDSVVSLFSLFGLVIAGFGILVVLFSRR